MKDTPVKKAVEKKAVKEKAVEQKTVEEKEKYRKLDRILQKYKGRGGVLIKALQEAQEIFGHLPRQILIHIAYELDVPLSEVYSVVSFYSLFKTKATGRCHLEICSGTACYVKGMHELLEHVEKDCPSGREVSPKTAGSAYLRRIAWAPAAQPRWLKSGMSYTER